MLPQRLIHPALFVSLCLLLSACGGGSGGAGTSADNERLTAKYFERIRGDSARERAFLYQMPKGGDIHNHLSGAVLAESYIRWATELNYCVCTNQTCSAATQYTIAAPSGSPPSCDAAAGYYPVAQQIQDPNFYNAMIDALSMRNFVPTSPTSGHDHFFATFAKFSAVSSVKAGSLLAEVASVWHAENVKYVELMLSTAGGSGARNLLKGMTWDPARMPEFFDYMVNHPSFPGLLAQGSADLDNAESQMRTELGCGTSQADPACANETIRYIYSVNRIQPPIDVFATVVFAFELAAADHRMIGVNLVAPEDDPVALRDYLTQMQIYNFLSQAVPGVKISLHAGELTSVFAPPEDLTFHVRSAIETGQASRIGHGVDIENETNWPQLMSEMAEERRLVEICLTSNDTILNVVGPAHPLETYISHGVPVTLATDDAGVSRIDLTHEYQRAADTYQFSYTDLKEFARNSLEYDFLPGNSLWKSTTPFVRTDECRHDSPRSRHLSPACQNLLNNSEHAAQQWQLEADLATFERHIARSSSAAAVNPPDP